MLRKLLFFYLLLAYCLSGNSQDVRVARHSYVDVASKLVSINTKYFYTEVVYSDFFTDSCNIVGLDSKGGIIFKKNLPFGESTLIARLLKTKDNCLLIIGRGSGCDFDLGPSNFILKLDTNGAEQFFISDFDGGQDWPDYFHDVIQMPDSSYCILTDSLVLKYSKQGIYKNKISTGLLGGFVMGLTIDGNLLVNGYDSNLVYKFLKISTTGSITATPTNYFFDLMIPDTQGNFYCLSENLLIKLDANLLPSAKSDMTLGSNILIRDFAVKRDTIYFTGLNLQNKTAIYGYLNDQLSPLYLAESNFKNNNSPAGIVIDKQNRISIISNFTAPPGPKIFQMGSRLYSGFCQFPAKGNFSAQSDIGVESFTLVNAEKDTLQGQLKASYRVTVKNYGNDTVKSFCLNSDLSQLICGYNMFHKSYHITIPPHQSAAVETGSLQSYLYTQAADTSQYLFKQDVCLFTTVPNQQPDADVSNDNHCSRILKSDTIVDRKVKVLEFSVFPNPFNETLSIVSPVEISDVTLHNILGQVVMKTEVHAKQCELVNIRIAAGVYFAEIKMLDGIQIKKVVKE